MAVCIPFARLWLIPADLRDFSQSLVAVSGFASNILFWRESGYFDNPGELKPLLHTWSLGIEEQYYVIFPLFMMLAWRLGKQWIAGLLSLIGVLSLAAAQWGAYHSPDATFYLLPTRAWELAIGGLIALYLMGPRIRELSDSARNMLSAAGLLLILLAVFGFSAATPFPSLFALVPCVGAALIILFASPATVVGAMLSSRPFVGIGLISYSAYLWHQPLFAFARQRSLTQLDDATLVGLSFASIALAYVSWRFIERPFRDRTLIRRSVLASVAVVGTVSFATLGVLGHYEYYVSKPSTLSWLGGREVPEKFFGIQESDRNCSGREDLTTACWLGDKTSPLTIVIAGDSHARALTEPANAWRSQYDYSLIDLTMSGCPFMLGVNGYNGNVESQRCNPAYQGKRLSLLRTLRPSVVVLFSRLSLYIHGTGFDNTVGGVEETAGSLYLATQPGADKAQRYREMRDSYVETVRAIQALGHTVVAIGPVPTNGWHPISRLYRLEQLGWGKTLEERLRLMAVPAEAVRARHELADRMIGTAVEQSDGVIAIDPKELFCDDESCSSITETSVLYADRDHLSYDGNSLLLNRVLQALGVAS